MHSVEKWQGRRVDMHQNVRQRVSRLCCVCSHHIWIAVNRTTSHQSRGCKGCVTRCHVLEPRESRIAYFACVYRVSVVYCDTGQALRVLHILLLVLHEDTRIENAIIQHTLLLVLTTVVCVGVPHDTLFHN